MTVFLISLLPMALFLCLFIGEIIRLRKYKLLPLALVFTLGTIFYAIAVANVIVTQTHLFPYSGLANRLLATSILPSFYLLCNLSQGHHISPLVRRLIFVPTLILFAVSFLPGSFAPGYVIGDKMPFYATVSFAINEQVQIGWSLTEMLIIMQALALFVRTVYDFHNVEDVNHRTDTVNRLINCGGLMSLTFLVQASIGCSEWIKAPDYALLDFCFNTFVISYGAYLLRKSIIERRYVYGDDGEFYPVESTINVDELIAEEPTIEEQKTTIPSIDFAVAPEIPREEITDRIDKNDTSTPTVIMPDAISHPVEEPSQKDLLALQLRTLVEQEKIYLQAGIRIDEVALTLGTNRTYLAKMMKEIYGHTFAEYMNICRLKSAQSDMLQRKDVSIETIALANGFNSSNTFNKVFNQFFGTSPAVWRKSRLS